MNKRKIATIVSHIFLLTLLFIWMLPILLALTNSFKTNGQLLTNVLSFPESINFDNYARTFKKMRYFRSFGNTMAIAGIGIILIILFSSMAGWKICRTKTNLSSVILAFFVFSMLIPFSSIMIPLYKVVITLNIKNSLTGLGLVYSGLGVSMAIFLYNGFVKGIPQDMEEAASIDGANSRTIFFKIILPLLKPITATIAITNVLWMWNDFLLPLIIISDYKKYTLLLSTNTLFGQYSSDWTAILSAMLLAALPMIVFYALLQKNILKGIADGALKN